MADKNPRSGSSAPKALRIGLFIGGKPLEERVLRRRQDVTLGTAQGATLIVPPQRALGKSFTLFEAEEDGYALRFTQDMAGSIFWSGERLGLDEYPDEYPDVAGPGPIYRAPLPEDSRGEVTVGDLKILFQFITPPAQLPRPQLPAGMRPSLAQLVDRRLGLIALGSFVVHFGFVMYLRAMEHPKPPDIEEIPERFVKMMAPKRAEPPKPTQQKVAEKKVEEKKEGDKKATEPKKASEPSKPDPDAAAKAEAARLAQKAQIAQKVQSMGVLKMLTAKGPGGVFSDVLKTGGDSGDPDKVFREVGGVGPATGDKGLGSARGGEGTGQSKGIGSLVASGPTEGLGTGEKTEKKVRGIVQESAPQDIDPVDLDPNAVASKIRQYRGALVACYEAALKRNATLSGKITLRFSIGKVGKVSKVSIEEDTMHDPDFNECIVERASNWRFPPPQSGNDDVQFAYPFIFQSSK